MLAITIGLRQQRPPGPRERTRGGGPLTDQARPLEDRSRLDFTRRTALSGGAAAIVASALAACGKSSEDSSAADGGAGAGNFPETPEYNFVFVNHVTTNPF